MITNNIKKLVDFTNNDEALDAEMYLIEYLVERGHELWNSQFVK